MLLKILILVERNLEHSISTPSIYTYTEYNKTIIRSC